jgi:hypothetical protein
MQTQIKKLTMRIEQSSKGLPVVWERGGMQNDGTGVAVVVGNHRGERKKPIFIRSKGKLVCDNHALFVVKPGDVLVESFCSDRRIASVFIYRVDNVDRDALKAELSVLNEFTGYRWCEPVPEMFDEIINAGILKATTHNCRAPVYV